MMATKTTQHTEQVLLGVYLNDHLAGATVGLQLARRAAGSAEPGSESATVRKGLVREIAADRSALIKIMTTLGIKIRGYKMFAAWAGEKAGRLKPKRAIEQRITYHDPCFMARHDRKWDGARAALGAIPGATVADIEQSKNRTGSPHTAEARIPGDAGQAR